MRYWQRIGIAIVALALAQFAGNSARADEVPFAGIRGDISLDLPIWPSLTDLEPAASGSFDSTGFGLGASVHWPVVQFANSDLLLGLDGTIAATDSSISGTFADLLARQLYLGGSMKWQFGDARNVSLDLGLGYHELDMAQVDSNWRGSLENEQWSESTASAFVGGTWDIGAGRPDHDGGLMLALRVHFADFGQVADEDVFFTVLGSDAGKLDGPLYMLRIGYSSR